MTTRKLTFDFSVLSWGAEVNGTCTGEFTPGTKDGTYYRGDSANLDVEFIELDSMGDLSPGERSRFAAEYHRDLLLAAGDAWAEQEQLDRDSWADAKRDEG